MFAGAARTTGTISLAVSREAGMLAIEAPPLYELEIGDSIAVSGVCLTVRGVKSDPRTFFADVSEEILAKTTLGNLKAGDRVNLEQALHFGDSVGGHLLLGHVDGMGRVTERRSAPGSLILLLELPRKLANYVVENGPIAIDGVSLPIDSLRANRLSVHVMPLTAEETTLGSCKAGDVVNVETDILGRYVARLLGYARRTDRRSFLAGAFSHQCASRWVCTLRPWLMRLRGGKGADTRRRELNWPISREQAMERA